MDTPYRQGNRCGTFPSLSLSLVSHGSAQAERAAVDCALIAKKHFGPNDWLRAVS